MEKPKYDNYLLLYTVEPDLEAEQFAHNIAQQIHCEVIRLYAYLSPIKTQRLTYDSELSPYSFLGYIAQAKCVITNSFHATSFSIIFNKDFYYLSQISNSRADSLMTSLGITNRLVKSDKSIKFTHVDYSNIETRIKVYRKKSINFLISTLRNDD